MNTFFRTISFFKEKKWQTALLVFAALIQASLSLVEPIFFREVIDILTNVHEVEAVWTLLGKIFLLWAVVMAVLMLIRIVLTYSADVLVHKLHVNVWHRIMDKVLNLSLRFHNSQKVGSTMRRIDRGTDNIFETQLDFLREDLPRAFALLLLIPLIFFLHWKMALMLCLILPWILLIAVWGALKTNKKQNVVEVKWTRASGMASDAISNISVIKSFTAFGTKMRELGSLVLQAHRAQLSVLKWWCFVIVLGHAAAILATMAVFIFGAYLSLKNEITIGEIVMFSGFALLIVNHVETQMWHLQRFLWRKHKLGQFFTIWDEKPEVVDLPNAIIMPHVAGEVEFRNVSFSHDQQVEALKNVSFEIAPGKTVALVGHTGSGKTTTVNLLSRFFDVDKGKIFVDGIDISTVTQESLRQNIGMVFQENLLFHASILDNLKIANPKASLPEIEKACHAAHALGFISRMPKGFRSVVGERGVKLSGGEKQRVAIARALLKDPPILVLDEATSALDAETEQKIQDALAKLIAGRTTFIVAHRLSTIKKADLILVFEKGKIVERGTYQTLMRKKGPFARLVHAQVSGFVV